jgi:ligand-binding sensor domain-containing protein
MKLISLSILLYILTFTIGVIGYATEVGASKPPSLILENFNANNGLPSSEIYRVHQDADGYLWFATDRGLARYDGKGFRTFTQNDGLAGNSVLGIYGCPENRFWVICYGGGISYYNHHKLYTFKQQAQLTQLLGEGSFDFYIGKSNYLYATNKSFIVEIHINYETGVASFIKSVLDTNQWKHSETHIRLHLPKNGVSAIPIPAFRNSTSPPSTKQLTLSSVGNNNRELSFPTSTPDNTATLLRGSTNNHFLITKNQVVEMDSSLSKIIYTCKLPSYSYVGFSAALFGKYIIIGTFHKGAIVYDTQLRKVLNITILPNLTVTNALMDREHNLWLTTLEEGIFLGRAGMEVLRYQPDRLERLIYDGKNGFYTSNSENVLFHFNIGENSLKQIDPISYKFSYAFENGKLYYARNDGIIIGDGTHKRLDPFDRLSAKWLGINSNGSYLTTASRSLRQIKNGQIVSTHQLGLHITDLLVSEDYIYIGTISGLMVLNKNNISKPFVHTVLKGIRISSMLVHDNLLWVSTLGSGIYVFDIKTYQLKFSISEVDGLLSNACGRIYMDAEKQFWVCSNFGLSHITFAHNYQQKTIKTLNYYNGLPSNEVLDIARIKNDLYCATARGLVKFNISYLNLSIPSPLIRITSLNTINTVYQIGAPLTLPWNQKDVVIHFTDNYIRRAPNAPSFRYRLLKEGDSMQGWTITTNSSVEFNDLDYGNYKLIVASLGQGGIWSAHPATIYFKLNPYFTETLWFKIFMVLAILALFWWITYIIINNIKTREALKLRAIESDLALLRTQMNPHFIFNSLSSIQNYILKNDSEQASLYLAQFSRLIRNILDYSNKEYIKLNEETQFLENYLSLEKIRYGSKFTYNIENNIGASMSNPTIPPLLLQPVIENAIKHGFSDLPYQGHISIQFISADVNLLTIQIKDNGWGLTHTQQRKKINQSLGLGVVKRRIELINAATAGHRASFEIKDLSAINDTGTIAIFKIPIQKL